jgi:hypothetical protein
MKKIILILAVLLLCGSAKATVEIILTDLGDGVIQIGYDATGETELVRAFALDIVATDGNIIDVNDYAVGDNNGGYGIFPGSFAANITVNPTTGMVDSWTGNPDPYTPVAPAGDPDALGQIPGPAITIEMGSLYDDAPPARAGVLCTITIDEDVNKVCVTGNAIRGNVVLEDASEATLGPGPTEPICWNKVTDCFPNTPDYAIQYAYWVAYGKPICWCGNVFPEWRFQCDCDLDGKTEGALKYRVFTKDLGIIVLQWKKKIGEVTDPCADVDHKPEGALKYRVFTKDLAICAANWKKKDAELPDSCPRPDSDIVLP